MKKECWNPSAREQCSDFGHLRQFFFGRANRYECTLRVGWQGRINLNFLSFCRRGGQGIERRILVTGARCALGTAGTNQVSRLHMGTVARAQGSSPRLRGVKLTEDRQSKGDKSRNCHWTTQ